MRVMLAAVAVVAVAACGGPVPADDAGGGGGTLEGQYSGSGAQTQPGADGGAVSASGVWGVTVGPGVPGGPLVVQVYPTGAGGGPPSCALPVVASGPGVATLDAARAMEPGNNDCAAGVQLDCTLTAVRFAVTPAGAATLEAIATCPSGALRVSWSGMRAGR